MKIVQSIILNYFVACGNCGVINGWVCNGERPGLEHIPQEVPNEIKWLMVDCWDGNVKKRPSFAGSFIDFTDPWPIDSGLQLVALVSILR